MCSSTLVKSNLDYTELAHCSLSGATIIKVTFYRAVLNHVDFTRSDMGAAWLNECEVKSCIFKETSFNQSSIYDAFISNCVFNNPIGIGTP